MTISLDDLQNRRQELLQKIGQVGDMRQGTITEVYRACGKPNCRCANPGDPGHGPYYAFTRKVGGKTKTLQLRAGPSLFKLEGEVEAYRRFRGLCTELVKVNEEICQARTPGDEAASDEVKKPRRNHSRRGCEGSRAACIAAAAGATKTWPVRHGGHRNGDSLINASGWRRGFGEAGQPGWWRLPWPAYRLRSRSLGRVRRLSEQERHHRALSHSNQAGLLPLLGM